MLKVLVNKTNPIIPLEKNCMDSKRKQLVKFIKIYVQSCNVEIFGLLINLKYSFWKKFTLIKETTSCLSEKGKEAT